MKTSGISFHHPFAFWFGCMPVIGGVLAHVPMFMMGQHTAYQMVGMPMDADMLIGMAMIPLGLLLAMYGLMPRIAQMRKSRARATATCSSTSPTACRSTASTGSW